jgi:tryptophan synthase alpha chain
MSKISEVFDKGNKAFIAYLMAGDPGIEKTGEYILAMADAGADIIELGVPFSDPIAEGETIQRSTLRAFASGANMHRAFELAESLKGRLEAPLLFMTYVNPVFSYGYDNFFTKCRDCGVSGLILPDLPFEEQGEVAEFALNHAVDMITLVAPTSSDRVERIAKIAHGFIYLVSSMGVTGVRRDMDADISGIVAEIRKHSDTPIAVGFGIHSPEQAAAFSRYADGVIVGSAIVGIIEEHGDNAAEALATYVRSMKGAMSSAG